jgi:5'-nucleotidase
MHFLLTNDDGIDAAGLSALEDAVASIPGGSFSVVAPAREQSQCGHRVTTHEPLKVEERGDGRYAVHGTPADCVRVALFGLGIRPDVVLSGVNHGGNMGQDLVISGTVAAAREAAYHGIRAAAFSHYLIKGIGLEWPRISAWSAEVLSGLLNESDQESGSFWNINFPHLAPGLLEMPELVRCAPARSPLVVDFSVEGEGWPRSFQYAASYASRPRDLGSDVEACFGGRIAVSRISV